MGRGVCDNKSGVTASLFAVEALKALGCSLRSGIRLFVGSNEESGMEDIAAYHAVHQPPEASIVPDCAFPVYRGEKGCLRFWASPRENMTLL